VLVFLRSILMLLLGIRTLNLVLEMRSCNGFWMLWRHTLMSWSLWGPIAILDQPSPRYLNRKCSFFVCVLARASVLFYYLLAMDAWHIFIIYHSFLFYLLLSTPLSTFFWGIYNSFMYFLYIPLISVFECPVNLSLLCLLGGHIQRCCSSYG